jgi:hypothetical protein
MTDPKKPERDWTSEDEFWRSSYRERPYAGGKDYEEWRPAYRYGHESAKKHQGRKWEEVEPDLRSGWDKYEHRGEKRTTWEQIKDGVKDAWNRATGD